MESTVPYAPKIPTGIDSIDDTWGGFYRGGSYLLFGRAAAGRGLLATIFARTGAAQDETCLYVSTELAGDIIAEAASVGFDLRQALEQRVLRWMGIPPVLTRQDVDDEVIATALRDLVSTIRQDRPKRLVLNDFMPFVKFRAADRFRDAFGEMLEDIDSLDTTLLLVMAEPANDQSRQIIDFMTGRMTGAIHIEETDDGVHSDRRRLTLLPSIGHFQQRVVATWHLPNLDASADSGIGSFTQTHERGGIRQTEYYRAPDRHRDSSQPRKIEQQGSYDMYDTPDDRRTGYDEASEQESLLVRPQRLGSSPPEKHHVHLSPAESSEPQIRAIPLGRTRERTEKQAEPATAFEAGLPLSRRDTPPSEEPPASAANQRIASHPYAPERKAAQGLRDPYAPEREAAPGQRDPYAPAYESALRLQDPYAPEYEEGRQEPSGSLPTRERSSHSDRDAFRARLQQHFLQRDVNETPFLLVAMRMDRSGGRAARPFDFEFIVDLVSELLQGLDDMLVDLDRERLIVLLADMRPEAAQGFFAQLKNRLRKEAPRQADHLLHSVSAIVVPDGRPFQNAEEFLTYALDED